MSQPQPCTERQPEVPRELSLLDGRLNELGDELGHLESALARVLRQEPNVPVDTPECAVESPSTDMGSQIRQMKCHVESHLSKVRDVCRRLEL